MFQTEQEYNKDNGFKSRKFLLSFLSIILIVCLAVIFAVWNLEIGVFSTAATSVVTIALGYSGISATRSVIPRFAQSKRETRTVTKRMPIPSNEGDDSTDEVEPEEGGV